MALDNDAEGENIAYEIVTLLQLDECNVRRLRFSAITADAIREAILHPARLDPNISNSVSVR